MDAGILHTHAGSWLVLVILFVLSYIYTKNKVLPMVLRLFYLIMIGTGAYILFGIGDYGTIYHIKATAAIIMIGFMEMTLVRRKKGKADKPFLATVILLLLFIVSVGYGVIGS